MSRPEEVTKGDTVIYTDRDGYEWPAIVIDIEHGCWCTLFVMTPRGGMVESYNTIKNDTTRGVVHQSDADEHDATRCWRFRDEATRRSGDE